MKLKYLVKKNLFHFKVMKKNREMNKMKICLIISNHFSILFSWFVLLLLHTNSVQAQAPISQDCPNTANYTSNSQFETNLNILLPSLLSNGTQDGFFNTSVGTGSDIVYGLVQCRGDISTERCRNCLNTSIVAVFQRCPNVKQAVLRYEYCFLRYSNTQFFSLVDGPLVAVRGGQVSDTVANRYNQQLASLLLDLSETAASRPSRYSSGSTTSYIEFNNIYGLVQCTRDLLTNDCYSCLESLRNWIPGCCNGSTSAHIFQKTCYLRYEGTRFFEITSLSPPPPFLPPIDASPPEANTGDKIYIFSAFSMFFELCILDWGLDYF